MPVGNPITDLSSAGNYVPIVRTLSINGLAYDLSADRSWVISTLSSLIASAPLSFNSGTSTISIPVATNSVNGYLSSADWLTFSSKQPAITLTTTGNNGSSTLIGATLNVPTYTLVGLGGLSNPFSAALGQIIYSNAAGAGLSLLGNTTTTKKFLSQTGDGTSSDAPVWEAITASSLGVVPTSRTITINGTAFDLSANRTYSVGTVTSVGLSSSTSGVTIGSTPITTSGTITLAISTASASTNGLLSSTDWSAFTAKLSNPFSAAIGQIIYSNGAGAALSLLGNTTTTKKFLSQTGDGTNSDAPFWDTITASSIGALSSVAIAVPTGFSVSNSPLTANGTITIGFASGYALPTTAKQTEWDSAYTNRITTLTTTGNSGASSLISNTLNIPTYTLAGLGGLSNPMTGANGAGDMIYANGAGAPIRLAPNTTTTKKYLSMTGDGTNGDAPFWDTITGFTGSGTTNYITKFTSSSAIGNSLLYDNAVSVSIGNTSPQKLFHLSGANGATVIRMENTDTSVSIGETIGAIEFYGNDTASGVGGIIDAYGGGLTGEVNIDVWAGTNGNIVGGVTVKYTGAVNFTPLISAPSPAAAGDVYYDSSTNKLRCYDGTSWNDLF